MRHFLKKYEAILLPIAVAGGLISVLMLGSCQGSSASKPVPEIPAADEKFAGYPAEWWAPVDPATAPSWEILPQSAAPKPGDNPMAVVLSKRTELGVFSNFANTPIEFEGLHFESIEGLWQSMKYPEDETVWAADPRRKAAVSWPHTRAEVAMMSDRDAKRAGDEANALMKQLGITWVTFKGEKIEYKTTGAARHYEIIRAAMRAKVDQHPDVKTLLLKTAPLKLLSDHVQDPASPPAYFHAEIYMKIRDELTGS